MIPYVLMIQFDSSASIVGSGEYLSGTWKTRVFCVKSDHWTLEGALVKPTTAVCLSRWARPRVAGAGNTSYTTPLGVLYYTINIIQVLIITTEWQRIATATLAGDTNSSILVRVYVWVWRVRQLLLLYYTVVVLLYLPQKKTACYPEFMGIRHYACTLLLHVNGLSFAHQGSPHSIS